MSLSDLIKSKFIEEFSAISVGEMAGALLLSFLLGVMIAAVYRLTYAGVSFHIGFALTLVMLSMVTSLAILTVSSNVVLSLGMVGALSIVRFRTAIKDPMDTVFMFWSIVAGIMTGAGYITVALLATLLLGLLFLFINLLAGRYRSNSYMVVIRYAEDAGDDIRRALASLGQYKIRSLNTREGEQELCAEIRLNENALLRLPGLRTIDGVYEVNAVGYNGMTVL